MLNVAAVFLMVARDGKDHTKSYKVPKLLFHGEENEESCKLRFEIGSKNQEQRKKHSLNSLQNKAPK